MEFTVLIKKYYLLCKLSLFFFNLKVVSKLCECNLTTVLLPCILNSISKFFKNKILHF